MINVAAGAVQYSGNYVPNVVWSGKMLIKFYQSTVFGDICNTDYEGEISKMGDSLKIRTTPTITISDYTKFQDLDEEIPSSDPVTLDIDRAKYFNFVVDDVDKFQSDLDYVEDFTRDASEQLKISTDRTILGNVYTQADDDNQGSTAGLLSNNINLGTSGSPVQLTKANILEYIVDLGTVLDEQDVPEDDRALVLPAWACGLIKKSDLKDASLAGDSVSIMRNGRLGMIDRFTIYKSNLLATTTDSGNTVTNIIACQKNAISFAAQFTKMETLRSVKTFGDIIRGLMVYGFKVLKPEALVWGYVKP